MLHRRTKGAADLADPRQRPRAGGRIRRPALLLLDEVAAHLDANRRAALYDEIVALGAQAWMTGTGAELFDDLGDRATCLSVADSDGTSVVTPV